MNFKSFLFVAFAFASFMFSSSVAAQEVVPTIFTIDQEVETEEVVEIDILVENYNDIVSSLFTVEWDSSLLRFVDLSNVAFDLVVEQTFNLMNVSGGSLNFLYFDQTLNGNSLPDNGVLFTIRLEAIAEENITTNITFGGVMEVVDTTEQDLGATFDGCEIQIYTPVNTNDVLGTLKPLLASINPNPFTQDAAVLLNVAQAGQLDWTLSHTTGQVIAKGQKYVLSGEQYLTLENTLFEQSGTYILNLKIGDYTLDKRLVYIQP